MVTTRVHEVNEICPCIVGAIRLTSLFICGDSTIQIYRHQRATGDNRVDIVRNLVFQCKTGTTIMFFWKGRTPIGRTTPERVNSGPPCKPTSLCGKNVFCSVIRCNQVMAMLRPAFVESEFTNGQIAHWYGAVIRLLSDVSHQALIVIDKWPEHRIISGWPSSTTLLISLW